MSYSFGTIMALVCCCAVKEQTNNSYYCPSQCSDCTVLPHGGHAGMPMGGAPQMRPTRPAMGQPPVRPVNAMPRSITGGAQQVQPMMQRPST
jgi:hypothetical protein